MIVAEASRQAQELRGQGDSEAIRIYAESFGRDPEFFAFYRSMQAYRKSVGRSARLWCCHQILAFSAISMTK